MMRGGRVAWRQRLASPVVITLACAITIATPSLGGMLASSSRTLASPGASPGVAVPLAAPTPAEAIDAFKAAERWLREGAAPPDASLGAGWTGVRVVARVAGQVVGRGQALMGTGQDGAGEAGPLIASLRACRGELARRAPDAAGEDASARARALASAAEIELEIAHALTPIPPGDLATLGADLRPGLDGVAVRLGGRIDALFPGELLTMGLDPERAPGVLMARLTGEPSMGLLSAERLASEHGAVVYRFASTHLAQPGPGAPPMFLHRGGRVVEAASLDRASLSSFERALSARLEAEVRIVLERTPPGVPPEDPDVWLAGVALARGAEGSDGVGALLERARARGPGGDAARALAIAMLVHAQAPMPAWADGTLSAWRRDLRSGAEGALEDPASDLRLWALALSSEGAGRREVAAWVRARMERVPPGMLAGSMPFLGWAARETRGPEDLADPAGERLLAMRTLVWAHQLGPGDLSPEDRDLLGGVVFTASARPRPTWHTARPLAFLAGAVTDPGMTEPGARIAELSRVLRSTRFLRQLAADESAMAASWSGAAPWAVRAAPWDQRQPLAAGALTLVTLRETMGAIDALAGSEGP